MQDTGSVINENKVEEHKVSDDVVMTEEGAGIVAIDKKTEI